MKKILVSLSIVASLFTAMPSYAHGDHAPLPKISETAVLEQSVKDLAIIVDEKEEVEGQALDASWKDIKNPAVVDKREGYYVVAFKHPTQNKTAYLLMADTGEYYAANFTGKFSGVAAQ